MDPLVIQPSSLELVTLDRIADEDLVRCDNFCLTDFFLGTSVYTLDLSLVAVSEE